MILGAGVTLALWWRRRWPVALALAMLPLGLLSSSAGPAGIFFLYTVAAYRRWQAAVLIVLLGFALLPAAHAVHPQGDSRSSSSDLFFGVLFAAVVVAWGMFRRSRRQTKRELLGRAQAEEQLRVEQIRHAERERIAREMHDVLAHRISLLSLHAGALEFRPDAPPEEIARAVAVIRASAHQALEDIRSVIGTLRDGADGEKPPPPQPTLAALPVLLDESRAAGMQLYADVHVADLAAVPDGIGRHALRVVQGGADERAQARTVSGGRPPCRGRTRTGAHDRGAQPDAGGRRRSERDSGIGHRTRGAGRARRADGRPPRPRIRSARRLLSAGLAAVALVSEGLTELSKERRRRLRRRRERTQ